MTDTMTMGVDMRGKEDLRDKENDDCDWMHAGGILHGVPFVFALQVL